MPQSVGNCESADANDALTSAMTEDATGKSKSGLSFNTMSTSKGSKEDAIVSHETVVDKTGILTAADVKVRVRV